MVPQALETHVLATHECGDLLTVRIAKPEGYRFTAGQWMRVTLDAPEGAQTRTLSHASAPEDGWLEIGTRLSASAFKRALAGAVAGQPIRVSPPGGRLSLPVPASSLVMLIGGVGITPVRSLVRHAIASRARLDGAVLLFGNRDIDCVPFLEERDAWTATGLSVLDVLEVPHAGWLGETGFITVDLVARHVSAPSERTYLVVGPPPMVAAMTSVMDALGVGLEQRTVESFAPPSPVVSGR